MDGACEGEVDTVWDFAAESEAGVTGADASGRRGGAGDDGDDAAVWESDKRWSVAVSWRDMGDGAETQDSKL